MPKSPDPVTILIALWGAITGTVALSIQLASFVRDRPRVVARMIRTLPDVTVALTNTGRQAITLTAAGLFVDRVGWRYRVRRLLRRSRRIRLAVRLSPIDATSRTIQPGASWIVSRPMSEVSALAAFDKERSGPPSDWLASEMYAVTTTGRTLVWPLTTVGRGENIGENTGAGGGTVRVTPGTPAYPLDGGRPIILGEVRLGALTS